MRAHRSLTALALSATLLGALSLAACGNDSKESAETTTTLAAPDGSAAACDKSSLPTKESGKLTVATGEPVFEPWMSDDKPENGKGYESALVYAIAGELGYDNADVTWVRTTFDEAISATPKDYDFNIQQYSINDERKKVVDFSDGYYTVNQAVVALKDSPIANATTVAELQAAKLGAQIGTTSLDFINDVVKPAERPYVYNDTNDAKSALQNGQIDGIVVDLPTAYYITAVEIPKGKIVGQFPAQEGGEQFGLLFAKGNPLVSCVNEVLAEMSSSGELKAIQDEWLAGDTAPYFTE